MENIIYENEDILVVTEDVNNDNFVENSDENIIVENENPNISSRLIAEFIIVCGVFIVWLILMIRSWKRLKKDNAFKKKYEEKNAYDHYNTSDDSGYSYSSSNGYNNNSYSNANSGYGNYSNNNYNSYNNNQSNSYNNYNNQRNNYNSGASSKQPINPFADEFEGKTPDAARKLYLKYMKAFHSDTGDGSDDEKVKLINAAYDEYKKKHGI